MCIHIHIHICIISPYVPFTLQTYTHQYTHIPCWTSAIHRASSPCLAASRSLLSGSTTYIQVVLVIIYVYILYVYTYTHTHIHRHTYSIPIYIYIDTNIPTSPFDSTWAYRAHMCRPDPDRFMRCGWELEMKFRYGTFIWIYTDHAYLEVEYWLYLCVCADNKSAENKTQMKRGGDERTAISCPVFDIHHVNMHPNLPCIYIVVTSISGYRRLHKGQIGAYQDALLIMHIICQSSKRTLCPLNMCDEEETLAVKKEK